MTFGEYEGRVGDIVTGIVQQRDQRHISVDLGKVEADLPLRSRCRASTTSTTTG